MDSDDAAKITALVAAQLAEHAAKEKAARDALYDVIGGISRGLLRMTEIVGKQAENTAGADARALKLIEVFGTQFVKTLVPKIIDRAAAQAAQARIEPPASGE